MNSTGTLLMRCVGCKTKREITLREAANIRDCSFCPGCGMPEVAVRATVRNRDKPLAPPRIKRR